MLDWELDCFDAKCTFLHSKLKENIYMKHPRRFKQYSTMGVLLICHLLSLLYNLKQAALDWYELLSSMLHALRFAKNKVNLTVLIYDMQLPDGCQIIHITAWHVDDRLGSSNNCTFLNWVEE